ncbi:MAG: hypothetical protein QOE76_1430 [Frankiales bacterium]|jgi:hypothetical protein|nr:hypothetical protein [Frankiales bacterium]
MVNSRALFGVTLPTTQRQAPECRVDQLELMPSPGAAAGSIFASLKVHNTSAATCMLNGAPRLAMLDHHGTVWHSSNGQLAQPDQPARPVVLLPNSWADSTPWYVGPSCGGFGHIATLRVMLPAGTQSRTVPFDVGSDGPDRCRDDGSSSTSPAPHPGDMPLIPFASATAEDSGSLALNLQSVHWRIDAPSTVRAGTALDYTVVAWSDSANGFFVGDGIGPLFRQSAAGTDGTYELNWGPILGLKTREAVAFGMRLQVAANAPTGPTTLRWQLVEPAMPPVTARVTVTP